MFLLFACPIPLLLQVACGGGGEPAPDAMAVAKGSPALRNESGSGGQATRQVLQSPAAGAGVAPTIPPAPPDGPPRWNPDGISAPQIEAQLARLDNAFQDESSCWTKEEPCDGDYVVELNRKSSGRVGWWSKTGRDVFVDTEDLLRLPTVPGAVTVFVKNNPASKDTLDVTLEDRAGKRLHLLSPLAVGASAVVSWTRTDDRAAGPYRLRLSARTGPGDHTVDYTVLPIAHSHWLAQAQAQPMRPQ